MFSMGIDLGTGKTAAAVTVFSELKYSTVMIPLSDNKSSTFVKSSVTFDMSDRIYTGNEAEKMLKKEPDGNASNFKIKMGTDYLYETGGKFHMPVELSAIMLKLVKNRAEEFMNSKVKDAVIAVPAYFNQNQRNATYEAASIAGIKVKNMISEPTAVAISYWNSMKNRSARNIMVFDMGSGTTDVSIVHARDQSFTVLSTYGNTNLGGLNMDMEIEDALKSRLRNLGITSYPPDLKIIAEKIKIKLSRHESASVILGKNKVKFSMDSQQLTQIVERMTHEIFKCIDMAINRSGITKTMLDTLIITGGPTKIPYLFNAIEKYMAMSAVKNINSETSVATGASIIAAGHITGENGQSRIKINDIVPISLGCVILNDLVVTMIPANTPVPCSRTRPFTTIKDYQKEIEVKVVQGERPLGSDNVLMGNFRLTGIKPAPRGEASINVTYSVDKNGILKVSAIDNATGSRKEIKIENALQHSSDEVKELKETVKRYFNEDLKRKKMAEVMNNAEELLYKLKGIANKQLTSETTHYNINKDILKLSKAIQNNNIALLSQLEATYKKEYSI
ncbi:Hsp70 family protein [Ferroplasma sp.]|uniref:Hsp70 family protein n=1 Tax=Ferroplasma sp. TaxID=2591003 RepID=UPI00307E7C0A